MLCCVNINAQSGLLPPLGNTIPVRSLVTGNEKLSHVYFARSIQGFTLHKRASKLLSVFTCPWSSITTKEAIQYKGLNARLFVTQYAHVIKSTSPLPPIYVNICQVKEAYDIFMPVKKIKV